MSFDEDDGADFYIVKKEESESSQILICLKGRSLLFTCIILG